MFFGGKNTLAIASQCFQTQYQVDMNVGKLIAQGRQAKEMSQKDLATKICEKPQVTGQ